jgi:hypothetical protein
MSADIVGFPRLSRYRCASYVPARQVRGPQLVSLDLVEFPVCILRVETKENNCVPDRGGTMKLSRVTVIVAAMAIGYALLLARRRARRKVPATILLRPGKEGP